MGLKVEVYHGTGRTTQGQQTCSLTTLGGLTPKFVMFFLNNATALDTVTTNSQNSIGFGDANASVCKAQFVRAGTGDARGMVSSTRCGILLDIYSPFDSVVEVSVQSFSADTVTLNWNKADGNAYKFEMVVVAGTDIAQSKVGTHSLTNNGATTTETLGWRPSFVVATHLDGANATLPVPSGWCAGTNIGALIDNANAQMGAVSYPYDSAVYPNEVHSSVFNNRFLAHPTPNYSGQGAVTATGFQVSWPDNYHPANRPLPYVAAQLTNGASVGLQSFSSPTAASAKNIAFGFTPTALIVAHTELPAVNTESSTAPDSVPISIGATDGTRQFAMSIADPILSNNHEGVNYMTNSKIAHLLETNGGTVGVSAAFTNFGANTVLTYSTVKTTARYGFALALAEGAGLPASVNHPGAALLF